MTEDQLKELEADLDHWKYIENKLEDELYEARQVIASLETKIQNIKLSK